MMIYLWYISCCLQSQKDVISGLSEELDKGTASDKWLFDSCECYILLAYSILENNSAQ